MKKITARYPGDCLICTTPIKVGEVVFYIPGEGVLHVGCQDPRTALERFWDATSAPAPQHRERYTAQQYAERFLLRHAGAVVDQWWRYIAIPRFDAAVKDSDESEGKRLWGELREERERLLQELSQYEQELELRYCQKHWPVVAGGAEG